MLPIISGLDGSRTRVQKPIPGPSTSVVCSFTFPPHISYKQDICFSSFMIRPLPQSFGNVVSYRVEAWVLKCRCSKSDCSNQAAYAKLSSAFNFKFGHLTHYRGTRFFRCMTPVETMTSPYKYAFTAYFIIQVLTQKSINFQYKLR